MTKKDISNWIMYHEINYLHRIGFSAKRIARYLGSDARTVRKYISWTEQEFEQHLINLTQRNKVLSDYELFVKDKLTNFPDTSTAQIHDWLKEHYPEFPQVSTKTVYNFVMYIRQVYDIPIMKPIREYLPVEELPYGNQGQVDFGEYNMRLTNGKRKKVHFFAMVLSRSRMKYVWFIDKPFTAKIVCQAHENAFSYFEGIPKIIVYDQDKTMLVDENIGDLMLTEFFKQYTKSRSFNLHFCRKSDPESKGKIENVIQYVKKNFLYNRTFYELETLNNDALGWLGRTANYLSHNFTKKSPYSEFIIEKQYLNSYKPLIIEYDDYKAYNVRKVNTISYKSNFYELPIGTYKGVGTQVYVREKDNVLEIYDLQKKLIQSYQVSLLRGQNIRVLNRKRDTSKTIEELMNQIYSYFTNKEQIRDFIKHIKSKYPRYTRDHLQVMLKPLDMCDQVVKDNSLDFCVENELFSASEFEKVLFVFMSENETQIKPVKIKLLNNGNLEKASQTPEVSNIELYENIINK
jgi:Integrase core domain